MTPGSKFTGEFEKYYWDLRDDEDFLILGISAPKADQAFFNSRKRKITLRFHDIQVIFGPVLNKISSLIIDQISAAKERLKQNISNVHSSFRS